MVLCMKKAAKKNISKEEKFLHALINKKEKIFKKNKKNNKSKAKKLAATFDREKYLKHFELIKKKLEDREDQNYYNLVKYIPEYKIDNLFLYKREQDLEKIFGEKLEDMIEMAIDKKKSLRVKLLKNTCVVMATLLISIVFVLIIFDMVGSSYDCNINPSGSKCYCEKEQLFKWTLSKLGFFDCQDKINK